LRFGRVLQRKTPIVIQEARRNLQKDKSQFEEREISLPQKENNQTKIFPIDSNNTPIIEQISVSIIPPFPERLKIYEGVENKSHCLIIICLMN